MVAVKKQIRTVLFICLLVVSAVAFAFSPTSAIALADAQSSALAESSPKDGALLSASPKEIRLTFKEPLEIEYASIFDNRNKEYSNGKIKVNPSDRRQIILTPIRDLLPGTYGVEWVAKPKEASFDTKLTGQIYFAVQTLSPPPKSGGAGFLNELSMETLPNWIAFFGMAVSFGGTLFVQSIAWRKDIHKRWQYWQIPIYFLTAAATIALFFVRKAALPEISLAELAGLRIGWVPLVQSFIFTLIFAITFTRWTLPFLGGALALNALVGHSYSAEYGGSLGIIFDTFHLLALSIWFGGLFALLVLAPKEGRQEWFKEKGSRFSRWALISMGVIILTGIAMTIDYAPSWNDFINSIWGASVLVKAGLTLLVVVLGYLQMRYLKQRKEKGTSWFARRTKWEIGLGSIILLVAAALINFIPLTSATNKAPMKATQQGVTAHIAVSPFIPGFNDVNIRFDHAPAWKDVYVRFIKPPEYNVVNRAFTLDDGRYLVSGDQMRALDETTIQVEAIAHDGRQFIFTFPPQTTTTSK